VLKGANISALPSGHHLNNFRIRIPLLLRDRTSVNVERRPTARVSQQFLSYFDVHAQCSQIRPPANDGSCSFSRSIVIPPEHPNVWTAFALNLKETSLLKSAHTISYGFQ
jgi:hypothetical protein